MRRIVDEGHEIGNHTFTHPNVSLISPTQFELELSATQRLLASAVGRHSLLFRAPYAEDSEPETIDQVRPVELASGRGYLAVGMQIDPDDWQRPGVDEIVRRTVEAAERGEGNVVLLHDAGGDRSQTVQAIPKLVEALRSRGFQFVTIADLLGRSRDDIMPPVAPESLWQTWLDWAGFSFLNVLVVAIHWLFLDRHRVGDRPLAVYRRPCRLPALAQAQAPSSIRPTRPRWRSWCRPTTRRR